MNPATQIQAYYNTPDIQAAQSNANSAQQNATNYASAASLLPQKLREAIPDISLTTDIIAGFPGETEKDFMKLREFVAETGFNNVGVFTYSREPGTSAADLPGQVPEALKTARMNELINTQSRVLDRMNTGLTGKTVTVLMDSGNFGRTYRDAPDIDGRVEVINRKQRRQPKAGDLIDVKITGASGYLRCGTII